MTDFNDIVERLRADDAFDFNVLEDAAKEIERLRQRVKELEAINSGAYKRVDALEADLAELRKSQGEPVAVTAGMPGTSGFTMAAFRAEDVPVGTKLYTSAPPIAEGWQLVPVDPTDEMVQMAIDMADGFRNGYKAMIASAPKYNTEK